MGNNRCGIPHVAYQQLMYPVTKISIAIKGNNHVKGMHDDSCYNNPYDMNGVQCNGNKKTINTYTQVSLCAIQDPCHMSASTCNNSVQ